ncbi:hypothetical protein GDO78_001332 [Eleutherodactylus coqui]|uniref:Uncharacterized protein n=1 Tax=Eleutherodactylus coqui TaxID=57060 RepID=A0A8J6FSN1_ELECQ|nr:hypothetical protein GDO78_001332 [Eleutherodactylus coqui]
MKIMAIKSPGLTRRMLHNFRMVSRSVLPIPGKLWCTTSLQPSLHLFLMKLTNHYFIASSTFFYFKLKRSLSVQKASFLEETNHPLRIREEVAK